jgi:hypothetical protein
MSEMCDALTFCHEQVVSAAAPHNSFHAAFSVLGCDIVLPVPSFTHQLHLSSRILSKDSRHILFPIVSQYGVEYMCEKPR